MSTETSWQFKIIYSALLKKDLCFVTEHRKQYKAKGTGNLFVLSIIKWCLTMMIQLILFVEILKIPRVRKGNVSA